MKKFFPVIIGVLMGTIASISLILLDSMNVAHGENRQRGSWWNNLVVTVDSADFNWGAVFNPSAKGRDLYNLVYYKSNLEGERLALREIAQGYGLTTDEARSVLGGSLVPIINTAAFGDRDFTHEEARRVYEVFVEDYNRLKDLYELEKEIELIVKPAEMFANGNLSDSGFDLVHDLSVIEEILFLEVTPSAFGGTFPGARDRPVNPVAPVATVAQFAPDVPVDDDTVVDPDDDDLVDGVPVWRQKINDDELVVSILDDDVCVIDDPFEHALAHYDHVMDGEVHIPRDEDVDPTEDPTDRPDDFPFATPPPDSEPIGAVPPPSGINPAAAGDWVTQWCPQLGGNGEDGPGSTSPELRSLGGVPNSYLMGSAPPGDGAPATISASICLDIQFAMETYVAYEAGETCVFCEVQRINENLEKTLDQSLIPNKVTGNYMESTKCGGVGSAISMDFITVWNPVPTPEPSDVIFGKNIFEEWNKFVENYQVAALPKFGISPGDRMDLSSTNLLQAETSAIPEGTSQLEIFRRVEDIRRDAEADAISRLRGFQHSTDASNVIMHMRAVLAQMEEMNHYFTNFLNTYQEINDEVLESFLQKETR